MRRTGLVQWGFLGPGALVAVVLSLWGALVATNLVVGTPLTGILAAATGLGADPMIALAGQNVGGSFAIIASPPRIALAVGVSLPPGERIPRGAVVFLLGAVAAATVVLGVTVLVLA